MRFGFAYASPLIYDALIWFLYSGRPRRRFRSVIEEIPVGSSVVDLCAGTSMFHDELQYKRVEYTAVDVNPSFVRAFGRKGIRALCIDIRKGNLPRADILVMNSSLYHFIPNVDKVLGEMLAAARRKVIILEAVESFSNSRFSPLERFAKNVITVDGIVPEFHFTAQSFRHSMEAISRSVRFDSVGGGRDMLAVFNCGNYKHENH